MTIVENIFKYPICGGTVDKHEYCFVCRDCRALGNFMTSIMTDCSYKHGNKEVSNGNK